MGYYAKRVTGNEVPSNSYGKKESQKKRTELTNKYKYCKVICMQALFSNENNERERNYG